MTNITKGSLGQALDAIVGALKTLDESSRITVVKAVCEHLNIPLVKTSFEAPTEGEEIPISTSQAARTSPEKIVDIRTLKEVKSPKNDIEMLCVVGYYLENHAPTNEKKSTIQTRDIEKYFKQADFPLPKAPAQALINTKKAGYLDSAGRGKYKLNPVGYNLVAHSLPRGRKK